MRRFTASCFAIGLACFPLAAAAQAPATPGTIADNDSVFIDGTTFKLTPGKAKASASHLIKTLGARQLGPGAIVFRSGNELYIVDTPLRLPDSSLAGRNVFVNAEKEKTNRIRIEYAPPTNPEHQNIHDLLKARGALETVQKLFSPLRLPTELTIRTISCGMINAWYEARESPPAIVICYDYLDFVLQRAPKETTPAGITRADAVAGQLLWIVAHEMGHALFRLLDLSVFGREEEAADGIAAYFLLHLGQEHARRLIGGAAYAYAGYMKDYKENPNVALPLESFASNHGAPEARFYNLLCVAYGARPELFGDIVGKGYLPKWRAESCQFEYETLDKAVRREIAPHVDLQMAAEIWQSNWLPGSTSSALAN